MTEDVAELREQLIAALEADEAVGDVEPEQRQGTSFVTGLRETGTDTWGTMAFVIALEIPQGSMSDSGHRALEELKEELSAHSSTKGAAWYGIASTVETALRISKGEIQLEPPRR